MKFSQPTQIELFKTFDLVGRELATLEDLTSPDPKLQSHPWLRKPTPGGLLSGFQTNQDELRQFEISLNEAIKSEVSRLEMTLSLEPTIAWLESQGDYQKLQKSLTRQAKLKSGSRFDRPDARFKLLQVTLIALGSHYGNISQGKKPGSMSSKDWDKAIAAVRTLKKLEKYNGLRLWKALPPPANIPYDWISRLENRLVQEKTSAQKPYDDGLSSDRAAARKFTDWLLLFFDEAPPCMVTKFANLIQYDATSIPRQVTNWVRLYRTDSLT